MAAYCRCTGYLPAWGPLDRALGEAAGDAGYPYCGDYNVAGDEGFSPCALTVRDGRRVSSNDAYLEPARTRSNLTVLGDMLVDRVLLDGSRACGVRTADGREMTAREVIIAAGTIHSPALLLRSGIGPETGRPVGRNLIEHALAPMLLVLNDHGRRPESTPVVSAIIRYSSRLAVARPLDMQVLPLGAMIGRPDIALLGAAAMQIFSRGEVRLSSEDPHVEPVVEMCMLSDERDRIRLRDGVRRVRQLLDHPALARLSHAVLAGEQPADALVDDDAIDAFLDAHITNYVHCVGTCRMGAPNDPHAVVDPSCRVLGTHGLRIVDASIMPDIPRANTHLTTVVLAERASALIREDRLTSTRR